jgi:hypothetical protein
LSSARGALTASTAITDRYELKSRDGSAAVRALIWLLLGLLAATPISEHYCNFDRFLRGGQDIEFSLIALLAFLCLILLTAHKLSVGIQRHLRIRRWFVRLVVPLPKDLFVMHLFDRALLPCPPTTLPLQLRV